MSELTMSKQEREDFLGEVHVGVLAVERPDGSPLVTPVWYRYSPGDVIEFNTEPTSEKTALLERSGRASLCVQREELPYAYVTVEGVVELDSTDRATRVDIAVRYLGTEKGTAYVENSPLADDIVVRIRPRRWRTSDFSKLDLPDS
jgi:uncharacterized protein